ncbi:MAG: hypothetical protein NVSMB51_09500 [Solirubrobacteraceae bacterium]
MSSALTPFSYAILALVGRGGASAHDLAESARRASRPYWSASRRTMYAEPKRLAELGFLDAVKQPGRTGERTFYTLSAAGLQTLRDWLLRPTPFPRIQSEAPIRLVAGGLVPDAELLAGLLVLHDELDEVSAGLTEAEAYAATLPDRMRYLRLVHSLGRHMIAAQRAWLAEVERELG